MSIEQTDTVDFLSIVESSGDARLTISDHLDWSGDEEQHLLLLQEKINAYLRFVESGEMVERFPGMKDRNVVITVFGRYSLSARAEAAFKRAKTKIRKAGFELEFRHRPEGG
jgi:hypothetical protein